MDIKSSNNILKYGNFQLLPNQNDAIVFRRALRDKSLLCIFNRSNIKKILKFQAQHTVSTKFLETQIFN